MTSTRPVLAWTRKLSILAVVALVAGAGCGGADDESATTTVAVFEPKPVLEVVVNDWTASAVNVAVAEQLIERYYGYPVEPVRVDDTNEMYDGLASGDLDAVLEIWPSTMTDRDRSYFERGDVDDLGPLGAVGKIGWYVPRYVVEREPSLATWQGYQTEQAAALFATAETAPDGRFLGTNPDYQQFDAEIIDNLGLPFTVEFSGSEADTVAEVAAATDAGDSILLYWWSPTAAVATYDLVNVTLPPSTEACRASAAAEDGGVDCDYPTDELFKAASPRLAEVAPEVYAFLADFTLTTDDQLSLLVAVEVDGVSITDAAAQWITEHPETWEPWLEP